MTLTILIVLVIVGALVALMGAGIGVGAVRFVRSYGRKKKELPKELIRVGPSEMRECSRCGKSRIIVGKTENLCAPCYSAMRTKKLD
ncbi:MAG TPA: hypothetical protein VI756_20085 [Blastocatellia bacterium]